ncbi:hypothetical protein BJV82DRAFT_528810 [Fennellomyces sp. T-0311]|nr:hypothetical protein BJV82DRAFT_528810 [Fennellomyces sp. T-0311]
MPDITTPLELYYLNLNRIFGFGEPIKLLLEDAQVPHEYHQINWEEMCEFKPKLIESGNPFGTVPVVDFGDGQFHGSSVPLMRLLCKKLGKYGANNDQDEYFLDCAADFSTDWHLTAGKTLFSRDDPANRENYLNNSAEKHYSRFNRVYGLRGGPYILGNEITYVDFLVYHIIDSDARNGCGQLLEKYSHLSHLVETFKQRPNLKDYILSIP